jgi:hypothetical protein
MAYAIAQSELPLNLLDHNPMSTRSLSVQIPKRWRVQAVTSSRPMRMTSGAVVLVVI